MVAGDGLKERTSVELATDCRSLRVVVVESSYTIDLARSYREEGLCDSECNAAEGKEDD